jgi:hypothetical protein
LVEYVLAPHVDRVQQADVVGLGEVAVARLHFVGIEDHVGGPYEREARLHADGRQRLLTPAVRQLGVAGGQFALANDLLEGAAGEDEFTGRRELAVLVQERQRAEPGLVAGRQPRVPYEPEDDLGQLLGVQGAFTLLAEPVVPGFSGLKRGGDGCPYLRSGQYGAGRRARRAELLQQRV